MIKTKELMLGNWVYAGAKTQFPMYVTGIFDDVAYLDFEGNEGDVWEEKEEDMFPVPITEEILLKNGFLKEKYSTNTRFYGSFSTGDDYVFFELFLNGDVFSAMVLYEFKEIKYVHQLQNILAVAKIDIDFKI